MGTYTVTGLINARGRQFEDWSADYRRYSHSRAVPAQLFAPVLRWLCARQDGPIVMAMDDTLLRKTGKKTHGVKYMRDPLGLPFRVNFVRAQRFVQISAACPGKDGQARMIPVDWTHAPLPQNQKPKQVKRSGNNTMRQKNNPAAAPPPRGESATSAPGLTKMARPDARCG